MIKIKIFILICISLLFLILYIGNDKLTIIFYLILICISLSLPMIDMHGAVNESIKYSSPIKRYYKTIYGPNRKNFKNLVDGKGEHLDFEKIKVDENFDPIYEGGNVVMANLTSSLT